MVLRRIIPVVLLSIATLGWLQVSSTVDAQGEERRAWAFYMGFWAGQQSWDWQADVLTDYPAMGAYDSRDPGVAATHIDQAQSAGIDGFVVSWYGVDDQTTTTPVLNNMLDRAAERGFQVGAAFDAFDQSFSIESLTNSLNYLVNDRANHPAYLRYQGKPVIFFVFQGNLGLSIAEWQNVRNTVDPDRNTIWIAEGLNGCCLYSGAMDGMYAFNLAWANGSRSTYSTQRARTLNAGGSLYIPMVHPGWDETLIAARDGRGNPTSPRARNDGQFLATSFNGAINSGANVIMVGTWNEFMENSHIEPSQQYGTQSLDT
ncbi:MAG: endo-1,3-alpha-glucanase family glycosylhydrolase, partial [Chloroflexota bacterium]